ncbi:MAG: glycerate kinase type-2 family protein [Acidobacteriota bacterium]
MAHFPEAGASQADNPTARQMRQTGRDIFLHALREASIESAFRRHVHLDRSVLRIGEDLYDLSGERRILAVAIGKAAYSMMDCLHAELGARLTGIAVGATEAVEQRLGVQYFRGGHPVPNRESWQAAEAVLRALKQQGPAALVIFLVSGGGSALLEKPISEDISLDDLAATYGKLVLSGATIVEINAIRKHLSAVKGGRLAWAAAPAQQVSILVSDVPDNALDALASGPTMPDSSSVEDCYQVAEKYGLPPQLPEPVRRLFAERRLEETPKAGDEAFARSRWWTVLSNAEVRQAAAAAAARAGFAVTMDNSCDDWDYAAAADYLLGRLRELRQGVSRVCLISGGEVTVRVENGGAGGRNQQFALYCAGKITGQNVTVLSAGTDGIDGNSPAAGAVVDGTTVKRARASGLDPTAALARFDAFPFFEALGDAIVTGPTGNNLRDLRVMLAY